LVAPRWCHLPNASSDAIGWRAEQCVATRQTAVRSVVEEPAGVGDASQLGAGSQARQPSAETVDVQQDASTAGTAYSTHRASLVGSAFFVKEYFPVPSSGGNQCKNRHAPIWHFG